MSTTSTLNYPCPVCGYENETALRCTECGCDFSQLVPLQARRLVIAGLVAAWMISPLMNYFFHLYSPTRNSFLTPGRFDGAGWFAGAGCVLLLFGLQQSARPQIIAAGTFGGWRLWLVLTLFAITSFDWLSGLDPLARRNQPRTSIYNFAGDLLFSAQLLIAAILSHQCIRLSLGKPWTILTRFSKGLFVGCLLVTIATIAIRASSWTTSLAYPGRPPISGFFLSPELSQAVRSIETILAATSHFATFLQFCVAAAACVWMLQPVVLLRRPERTT